MTYPPISESGGVRHYMLNYELYMSYTWGLHAYYIQHVRNSMFGVIKMQIYVILTVI